MATIRNQPTTVNYQAQNKFRFVLQRAPNVMFFCQKATIPSLSLQVAKQQSPFQPVIRPGHKIDYEYYPVTFKVAEDLSNYMEIFNWMNNLGFPEDFSGYTNLANNTVSDATMIIETSKTNPNISIIFRDMFPVALSELEFEIDEDDIRYLDATVTFAYQRFTVNPLFDTMPID